MPSLHSDLVDNDDHWVQPSLDHAAFLGTDFVDSRLALTSLNTCAPTVVVFALAAKPDSVRDPADARFWSHKLVRCVFHLG